jgi:hypothetical protein
MRYDYTLMPTFTTRFATRRVTHIMRYFYIYYPLDGHFQSELLITLALMSHADWGGCSDTFLIDQVKQSFCLSWLLLSYPAQ